MSPHMSERRGWRVAAVAAVALALAQPAAAAYPCTGVSKKDDCLEAVQTVGSKTYVCDWNAGKWWKPWDGSCYRTSTQAKCDDLTDLDKCVANSGCAVKADPNGERYVKAGDFFSKGYSVKFPNSDATISKVITFEPNSANYVMYDEDCNGVQNTFYQLGDQMCLPNGVAGNPMGCQLSWNKLFGKSTCNARNHHADSGRFVWRADSACFTTDTNGKSIIKTDGECEYLEIGGYSYSDGKSAYGYPPKGGHTDRLFALFDTKLRVGKPYKLEITYTPAAHTYKIYDLSCGTTPKLLETQTTEPFDKCSDMHKGKTDLDLYFGGQCHAPSKVEVSYDWYCTEKTDEENCEAPALTSSPPGGDDAPDEGTQAQPPSTTTSSWDFSKSYRFKAMNFRSSRVASLQAEEGGNWAIFATCLVAAFAGTALVIVRVRRARAARTAINGGDDDTVLLPAAATSSEKFVSNPIAAGSSSVMINEI